MSVQEHSLLDRPVPAEFPESPALRELRAAIEHAAHLLPAQGPITSFVHHNTLHAFEGLTFDQAVRTGGAIFGCQPYLPEAAYRKLLESERITPADLRETLLLDLGEYADAFVGRLGTRYHLRLAMLQYPLLTASSAELRWFVAETNASRRFRPETPATVRKRTIGETRHWVMRDLRNGTSPASPGGIALDASSDRLQPVQGPAEAGHYEPETHPSGVAAGLIDRFGKSRIETWSDATWEAFCLQMLWRICRQGVHGVARSDRLQPVQGPAEAGHYERASRHRDILLLATGEDSDLLVHDLLIRLSAAFLDQGLASWTLPQRSGGFFRAFVALYAQGGGPPDRWLRGLSAELRRLSEPGVNAIESVAESLELLGVEEHERGRFIGETLLALRGFAGMIWQCESRGDRVAHPAPEGSLVDFLAVRLILERFALAHVARTALGFRGPLRELRSVAAAQVPKRKSSHVVHRAFLVFQLAQILGWTPRELHQLSKAEWSLLVKELEAFSSLERRRVFHLAYERRYRIQTLDAVIAHEKRVSPNAGTPGQNPGISENPWVLSPKTPRYQVVCCIDEREESFRRHLEEVAPECETLGAAGFFGVAMYYRGAAEAYFTPLCPAIIHPQHFVCEEVVYTFEESHRRRAKTRRAIGAASHNVHVGSRTFLGGAFLAAMFGPLASIPLVARVLFPRLTARIRRLFGRFVQTPPVTDLHLERSEPEPGTEESRVERPESRARESESLAISGSGHSAVESRLLHHSPLTTHHSPPTVGYTLPEMAGIVERLLRDMGLTSNFAPLVVVTGHGSSSLNNPHEAAHDCGACGGARGGPNARAFARMANDPRVREIIAGNGLKLPPGVHFLGAYHNSCDDSMDWFDLDRLPATHRELFETIRRDVDEARKRSAHERCRRFESAALNLSTEAGLRHVEGRAEDLAQTRPEYGHATNALCFVGRRWKSRGLFLDRRAFLTSYDPRQDDADCTILTRVLSAVVPVCAGINLEYYFSFVDSTGYGCGTKLPHNVTSLLGVMDGAASDLRTGLPWQMVEIHEPVRLLFIIETTPQAMLRIMDRNEAIGQLCRNDWVQVATQDPATSEIHVFHHGRFEVYHPESHNLPTAKSSLDWYRGWRDHLGFASIGTGSGERGVS